jgi:hypothetical protein
MSRGTLKAASIVRAKATSSAASSGPAAAGSSGLHDRDHAFAHLGIGQAEDGDVGDGGVHEQGVFDLPRIDVHLRWVLRSLRQVPVLVKVADVADRGSAAAVAHRGGQRSSAARPRRSAETRKKMPPSTA